MEGGGGEKCSCVREGVANIFNAFEGVVKTFTFTELFKPPSPSHNCWLLPYGVVFARSGQFLRQELLTFDINSNLHKFIHWKILNVLEKKPTTLPIFTYTNQCASHQKPFSVALWMLPMQNVN